MISHVAGFWSNLQCLPFEQNEPVSWLKLTIFLLSQDFLQEFYDSRSGRSFDFSISTGKKLNNACRTDFIQLVTASLFFAENLFIL